jgi:hypothetical protein
MDIVMGAAEPPHRHHDHDDSDDPCNCCYFHALHITRPDERDASVPQNKMGKAGCIRCMAAKGG